MLGHCGGSVDSGAGCENLVTEFDPWVPRWRRNSRGAGKERRKEKTERRKTKMA